MFIILNSVYLTLLQVKGVKGNIIFQNLGRMTQTMGMVACLPFMCKNTVFTEFDPDRWDQPWGGGFAYFVRLHAEVETSWIWGHRSSGWQHAASLSSFQARSCLKICSDWWEKHLLPLWQNHSRNKWTYLCTHENPTCHALQPAHTHCQPEPHLTHTTYQWPHVVEEAGLITSVKQEIPLSGWRQMNTEGAT